MNTSTVNCPNCGAPLSLGRSGSCLQCPFCGTSTVMPTSRLEDCVVPLGQPTDRNCPVCLQTLVEAVIAEREGEFCPRCHGILVPSDDFLRIVQERRAEYSGVDAEPTPIDPEALNRRISCPACHATMDVHPYYGPGNTVIDSCCTCELVWLDSGELTTIERAPGCR